MRGGANLIDVNMDEGMLDSEQAMTDVPQLHRHRAGDRARADHDRQLEVVGASTPGLKCVQGKAVVNSISLKEGEADFLDEGARSSGATAPASS